MTPTANLWRWGLIVAVCVFFLTLLRTPFPEGFILPGLALIVGAWWWVPACWEWWQYRAFRRDMARELRELVS